MSKTASTPSPAPPAADLSEDVGFAAYRAMADRYDEMVDHEGHIRPHWTSLAQNLTDIGGRDLRENWEQTRRLSRENVGIDGPVGEKTTRRTRLDLLPMVLDAGQWDAIAQAVAQRAHLLNRILQDLYGPQHLLRNRIVPPEIFFGDARFVRSAQHLRAPRGMHLALYAVDLARSPDGQWWVVDDHCETPVGAGAALINRITLSRVLPETFAACGVHRLASFFGQLRHTLLESSQTHRESPRIVVLTPGVTHPAYFEQAYMARYLGFALVEAGDLMVRDAHVYLKTLSGLLPVDVILRQVASDDCDPLELRDDSTVGVPGLLSAVSSGNVVMANAVGAGAVESRGLAPFLPGLCQQYLDEELRLPDVATWWCGQDEAFEYVREHFDDLVLRPTRANARQPLRFGRDLSQKEKDQTLAQIAFSPYAWVGQEAVQLSTAPRWLEGRIEPSPVLLRVYAAAGADHKYHVMPGGLTQLAGAFSSNRVNTFEMEVVKDTWVLSEQPPDQVSLLSPFGRVGALSRAGFILPSRIADNLFWLGRYAERVEFSVRIIRCLLNRLVDEAAAAATPEVAPLLAHLRLQGRLPEAADPNASQARLIDTIRHALFDGEGAFSLRQDVDRLVQTTVAVRDRMSIDAWRVMRQLGEEFVQPRARMGLWTHRVLSLMDRTLQLLSTFAGQSMEGMTRDRGWMFLDMGRRLERAWHTAGALRETAGPIEAGEPGRLQAMLEVANSAMTYHSRYLVGPHAEQVVDLVVADESNPRSIAFQLVQLDEHLSQLEAGQGELPRSPAQRMVLDLLTAVRLIDAEELARFRRKGRRPRLDGLLQRISTTLDELARELMRRYLTHASPTTRHVGEL